MILICVLETYVGCRSRLPKFGRPHPANAYSATPKHGLDKTQKELDALGSENSDSQPGGSKIKYAEVNKGAGAVLGIDS